MDKEKVILVTGGSKRIGAEIARYFHNRGFKVIIHFNKSVKEAESLKKNLLSKRKGSCLTIQADFFDENSISKALKEMLNSTNKLDVLINNASSFFSTPIETASREDWSNLLDTNATIPLFLTQTFKPLLDSSKGCIINISDSQVYSGISQYSLYAAAKAALESLTKSLSRELAPNIRVNAIAPGIILWPENDRVNEEVKKEIISKTALGRMGSPKDIAAAAYFLYQSTYMTGQVLKVDGGRSSI
tara:strand:- start:297 stop:1031 length:735 start_codon:yes stop_codon:yes gene_type:complete